MAEMLDLFVALNVQTRVSLKAKLKLNVLILKVVWPNGLQSFQSVRHGVPVLPRLKAEISTVQKVDLPVPSANSAAQPVSSSRAIQPFFAKSTRSKSRADFCSRMMKTAMQ